MSNPALVKGFTIERDIVDFVDQKWEWCMRISATVALLILASASATAQSYQRSGPGYASVTGEAHVRSRLSADDGVSRECLIRKSDGRTFCRTLDEWRVIAARIAASESQAR